jgi:predicted RND superfamily exporter protein
MCLLLVGSVLFVLLVAARQRGKLPVLLASVWGPAAMMALLWALRVPLSFLTCIFASVLVGMTGDNVIQYLFATRSERIEQGIQRRGGASILVAVSMAVACLVFTGSAFVPSRRLGALLALGFLLGLAGDLWILRGLLAPTRGADTAPTRGACAGTSP